MDITFRQAKITDLPIIVEMLADDALGKSREDFQHPLPSSYTEAFKRINDDPNQELMVVISENVDVIGTFQLSFIQYLTYQGGLRAQIEAVRIKKGFRGIGLGKEMFLWAIGRARKKGAHVLQLTTDKKRPEALQFYKNFGFRDSHEGMKLHL